MNKMEIFDTDAENIAAYPICTYKDARQEGYKRKMAWLKKGYPQGLRFKLLQSEEDGTVGTIEYVPGEYAWRGVEAEGYMVIHCIFLVPRKYKGKGYGSLMVEECLKDARGEKMQGVAVVTRKGTWMAGRGLFLKHGFEVVEEAPPDFSLLVTKFRKTAPSPSFSGDWDKRLRKYGKGLTIIKSDQCPYVAKAIREIGETAREQYGIEPHIVEVTGAKQAQKAPSAYGGVFNLVYEGALLADHPISNTRFKNIMNKTLQ